MIVLQQSTEPFPAGNRRIRIGLCLSGRKEDDIALALMRPLFVMMSDILVEDSRSDRSPNRILPAKASSFTDLTHLSAKAFR
jgi:hypothetical protein